ncbi:MAG: NACHT domain-containing protein [Anaerolineales bacterium]
MQPDTVRRLAIFGPFGPFGIRFDFEEFILGIVAGILLGLLLGRLKPSFAWVLDRIKEQLKTLRSGLTSRAIDRYQVELISRAETMHLARAILALDEILIPPRVLVPPTPSYASDDEGPPSDTLGVVPNLPDFTYLSGVYVANTLSLSVALSNGTDLMLTGEPGSGRSTALAYLAIRLANRDEAVGELAGKVPILVHAADLPLRGRRNPLEPLIEAAQRTVSPSVAAMLPGYIEKHFENGNALLLLDGLDEMPAKDLTEVSTWLKELRGRHQGLRIVAAGPTAILDGLADADLTPVPIAPWTERMQREFFSKWGRAWNEHVVPNMPKSRLSDIDPALINGWMAGTMRGRSPAVITLRVWAAYAGDVRGQRAVDDLESYAARVLSPEEQRHTEHVAEAWLQAGKASIAGQKLPKEAPISSLVEAGILVRRSGGDISFFQPAVGAYFGARAMARGLLVEGIEKAMWEPAIKAMHYYAVLGDPEAVIMRVLSSNGEPLESGMLSGARWLPDTSSKAEWRGKLLREVAKMVQDTTRPYGLRLRGVHALAMASEPSVSILFTRMLKSQATSSRVLACLGLGGMADEDSAERLVTIAQGDSEPLVRQAACLALGAIGSDTALEGLGQALLGGDEQLRLAAAEALAVHPDEGYGMLREAAEHEEIMTRRAAAFGLARIQDDWASDVLERVKVDDEEWIVRGAAAEALDRRLNPPWKIYPPPNEPSELPWVVAFAAKEGLGVAPGKATTEMLRRALSSGVLDEKIAALEVLGWGAGEELTLELYKALESGNDYLRDVAFESLWRLSTTGVRLPDPLKFGY